MSSMDVSAAIKVPVDGRIFLTCSTSSVPVIGTCSVMGPDSDSRTNRDTPVIPRALTHAPRSSSVEQTIKPSGLLSGACSRSGLTRISIRACSPSSSNETNNRQNLCIFSRHIRRPTAYRTGAAGPRLGSEDTAALRWLHPVYGYTPDRVFEGFQLLMNLPWRTE